MSALALLALIAAAGTLPTVTLSVSSANLVLGVDQETELRVQIAGDEAQPLPEPRLFTSAGRVEDVQRIGPRAFTARYLLPSERFPQAAIVVAQFAVLDGAPPLRGFVTLRLRAATSPRFDTDPGAQVTLRIGEKEFGPQIAGKDGSVRIPIVVPPGVAFGIARSVSRRGQTTESTVDLRIPVFRRVLLAAPDTIAAGTTVELAAYAVEPSGQPAETSSIQLRSSASKAQALGGRPGEARYLVRAPATLSPPALTLEAALRGQPGTAVTVEIPLVPDRPARLSLRPDRPRLPIGVASSMRVYLSAQDRFGNRIDAGDAVVLVDGAKIETRAAEDGQVIAIVPAPAAYRGRSQIQVEAALGRAYATQKIPLTNIPAPAHVAVDPSALVPTLTLTPRLGVSWNPYRPPGPTLFVEAMGRRAGWPAWLGVGLLGGLVHSAYEVGDRVGVSRVDVTLVPLVVVARARHRPARQLVTGVGAGAGLGWARTRVRSFGQSVPGHDLAPAALLDAEAAWWVGRRQQLVVGARYLLVRLGRVSSGDRIHGNSAGLVADVGYRLAW